MKKTLVSTRLGKSSGGCRSLSHRLCDVPDDLAIQYMPILYATEEHARVYEIKIILPDSRPRVFDVSPFKFRVRWDTMSCVSG